jgi:signal transduction histidine kinase
VRWTKREVGPGLAQAAALRGDTAQHAQTHRPARTQQYRLIGIALVAAVCALVYASAESVLAGAAPAWMLLAVAALGVACLALTNAMRARGAALHEAERELSLVAASAALGVWRWDRDSDRILMDARARELLDVAQQKGAGTREDTFARMHPDDVIASRRMLREAIDTETYDDEFRIVSTTGASRWIRARGSVEFDDQGTPVALHGVLWDATERRTASERFRALLDAAPAAILLVDARGRITLANANSSSLFGVASDALVGCTFESLVPCAPAGDDERESMSLARDGRQIPVEVARKPMILDGESCTLVVVNDLTERKARDAETVRQRDALAHLSRVKVLGELCGALAHELNQPLAAIMTNAQAAQRMMRASSPDLAEVGDVLTDIVDSDRRASDVIRRLRSWLRKEHEEFAPLDVNECVGSSLRLIRTTLIGRGVVMELALGTRLPYVFGDRVQLQQVMVNLLMNGCDAMDGLPAPNRLIVRTEAASGRVRICVEDEGTGIAEAVQERLFEPFETTKVQGMGMGLAVCRTIVEAHGGTIHAANNPSRGATVWFDLPGMTT